MSDVPFVGDATFEVRSEVLKTLANRAGLRLPDTRVPEGTSLLAIGEEAKRQLATDVKNLPDLVDGLMALKQVLTQEQHTDFKVPLGKVRMSASNGGLYGEGNEGKTALAYTSRGFSHVTQLIKPESIRNGFSENMLALPSGLRSQVFNHWASGAGKQDDVYLRTFKGEQGAGRRIIRAVTSDKHSLSTGDDLTVAGVLGSLPKGAKLRVTRTVGGDRSELEVIWPAMERTLVVGDVAMMALRISNSETKGGCLVVEPTLLRVLCYNFTTAWAEGLREELSVRHVGDLSRKLPRLIKRATDALEPFIRAFGDAYRVALPAGQTRADVLMHARKALELPESVITLSQKLWDADGVKSAGDTLAGFGNALTRASQEFGMEQAGVIEAAAGRVIRQGWAAIGF